jgi:MFS family permease
LSEAGGPPSASPDHLKADWRRVVGVLGVTQILAWGSSYYLPAVLARPIAEDTGWPFPWVVGGLSLGLVVSGIASPRVGRAIQAQGGRRVLAASSALIGLGQVMLGLAPALPVYLAAWLVVGLGMGAGLYDAAFATLGRYYGQGARRTIVALTLFGGFASTVCWPLSAFFLSHVGWRGTCFAYAAIQLLFALPLHLLALPKVRTPITTADGVDKVTRSADGPLVPHDARLRFILLATAIAVASAVSATVSVHLLAFLQAKGLALAAAVALGAMVGPAQVTARVVELVFGRYYHPIFTKLAATSLVATGLALLLLDIRVVAVALVAYGAGIGIESIARGTLPLVLFGAERYAALMGRIAFPSFLLQALAPTLAALLLAHGGVRATLGVLVVVAVANVGLTGLVGILSRRRAAR